FTSSNCYERESDMHRFLSNAFKELATYRENELQEQYENLEIEHKVLMEKTKKGEDRRKIVEANFSSWDNSSDSLVRYVKSTMHNPNSFEHVSTKYQDLGDYISISMTYLGSNAFGGTVTDYVSAKIDIDGDILEVSK
ncbi:MAG: hypothetical protein ACI9T9_002122, partial [Oleiphilaceae bacterium]